MTPITLARGGALDAYLHRIAHQGTVEANYATLEALHLAHATHIPFENIDVVLGRPIALDTASLQRKLVDDRRGGYCYEHNTLFAAMLDDLGFAVTRLAARVRYGTTVVRPRTHMLLLVETEGRRWIADVGFGGDGLLLPVPLAAGVESRQFLWTYRVVQEEAQPGARQRGAHEPLWVMQSLHGGTWMDLYAFSLEPQEPADFELMNYYTSTHPNSRFVRNLIAQRPAPDRRLILHNDELTINDGAAVHTRTLAGDGEIATVLETMFGILLPLDVPLRLRSAAAL